MKEGTTHFGVVAGGRDSLFRSITRPRLKPLNKVYIKSGIYCWP